MESKLLQYYCIPSCDKCREARKILSEKGIAHSETDMRKDGLSAELIDGWIERFGLDAILNTRSATWRGLDDAMKVKIESAPAEVINHNAAMLKRPILDFGDHILTAKEALEWLRAE